MHRNFPRRMKWNRGKTLIKETALNRKLISRKIIIVNDNTNVCTCECMCERACLYVICIYRAFVIMIHEDLFINNKSYILTFTNNYFLINKPKTNQFRRIIVNIWIDIKTSKTTDWKCRQQCNTVSIKKYLLI